jgi:hypothetical protein
MKAKSRKKPAQYLLHALLAIGIISVVLTGCSPEPQATIEEGPSPSVAAALASRDAVIEDLVKAFDEVDANLEMIRSKESELRNWAEGEEVLGKREDRIVRDIQVINTLMADNRTEIANLRERIRKSGINVSALETRLNHLEMANLEKSSQLEELKTQLVNAETSLAALNDTLSRNEMRSAIQEEVILSQSQVIIAQDCKLHEAYVATGSYKELKARGLVDKKGALLGLIGGEKHFTANTNPDEFVMIDQRDQLMIPVVSKKVELITPHPDGSYQLAHDAKGKVSAIEIIDPEEFWQSSAYLIVATE